MTLYQKLEEARKLVRNTKHKKKGKNTFSKYSYFTPEQVEQIVAEVCEKTKLLPLMSLRRNEYGLYQEMTIINLEDEKESPLVFELATVIGELKATNATQQMGGTDTYSERYLKMKVFQIKDNNLEFDSYDQTNKAVAKSIPLAEDPEVDFEI